VSAAVTAYVGVGANLGFAKDAVLNALADLARLPQSEFLEASSLYSSVPIDAEGPDFINAVAGIATTLTAPQLMAALQGIERQYGRVRTTRNAPRTLDLDLLLYGDAVIHQPELIVPHERLVERAFALLPLIEIDPDVRIPGHGQARDVLARLPDQHVTRLAR
jgi:2-amino-4-hydroxy-6-hydroxymethyldihydropteridine diphosphokinase